MELTGVIFAVIVAASLLYLIPSLLKQRSLAPDVEQDLPFGSTMRTIHVADPTNAIDDSLFVSTPYMRRAQLRELRRLDRTAAVRRRWTLLGILATLVVTVTTSAMSLTPWWSVGIPVGLLIVFVAVARTSVRVMRRRATERVHEITEGDDFTDTICFAAIRDTAEREVELTAPIEFSGSLWDPIPVTVPTYVQKPLAPRTVRTIDLSAPLPASTSSFPPTAEKPVTVEPAAAEQLDPHEVTEPIQLPRAVGE